MCSSPMAVAMNQRNVQMKAPVFTGDHMIFNAPPCHFHAHIVVAASIPAMNETISTAIARSKSLIPVSRIMAVASSEIFHQQLEALYLHGNLINADFTGLDHDVVIVVVGSNIKELLGVCHCRVNCLPLQCLKRRESARCIQHKIIEHYLSHAWGIHLI